MTELQELASSKRERYVDTIRLVSRKVGALGFWPTLHAQKGSNEGPSCWDGGLQVKLMILELGRYSEYFKMFP